MKAYILILSLFLSAACAGKPPVNNAANERTKERNKQTAAKNEMIEITRLAQTLEQQGRDMQAYRESSVAESARQCNLILEERQKGIVDLDTRIKNLPENYRNKLMPIVGELNECVSCARKTLNDCKKARASVNEVIKELFP